MLPVRCFTCHKVLSNKYRVYERDRHTIGSGPALDKLGLSRYCCRQIMMCHVPWVEKTHNVETLRWKQKT